MRVLPLLLTVLLSLSACVTLETVAIGQKTALERQLMGPFEGFSEEELLVSSVRAAALGRVRAQQLARGETPQTTAQRALAARRRQLFNRDELNAGRRAACIGEALGARVALRPCLRVLPRDHERFAVVVAQENSDRAALIAHFLIRQPAAARDEGSTRRLYRELLLDEAPASTLAQRDDRTWPDATQGR